MLIMADPTIILVHGAFADASNWSRLYAEPAGRQRRGRALDKLQGQRRYSSPLSSSSC
jgi:pimeloyl-ACP methyl ester carboxylesterase